MDLKQLEAFVSIATLGSFRGAANRLNLSQPAISLRLKALEDELGTPLFERQASKIQLTGTGLQVLSIAEEILESAHRLKATAAGANEVHQRIRLGATSTIANAWLGDLIEGILKEYRHLFVDVVVDTTQALRSQLIGGEIDVALLMGAVHEKGIRNVPLKSVKNEWIAGLDMAIPDRRLSLQDIAAFPIVTYAKSSDTYSNLDEAFRLTGIRPVSISTCNSVATIFNLVRRNICVGTIADACLPREGVRVLDCEMPSSSYQYFLAYHLDSVGRTGMAVADVAKAVC